MGASACVCGFENRTKPNQISKNRNYALATTTLCYSARGPAVPIELSIEIAGKHIIEVMNNSKQVFFLTISVARVRCYQCFFPFRVAVVDLH